MLLWSCRAITTDRAARAARSHGGAVKGTRNGWSNDRLHFPVQLRNKAQLLREGPQLGPDLPNDVTGGDLGLREAPGDA